MTVQKSDRRQITLSGMATFTLDETSSTVCSEVFRDNRTLGRYHGSGAMERCVTAAQVRHSF